MSPGKAFNQGGTIKGRFMEHIIQMHDPSKILPSLPVNEFTAERSIVYQYHHRGAVS